MLLPMGIEPGTLIASDSKSNTLYTNLTFSCKTETLGSLYSHALLMPLDDPYIVMPLKSSKSKYQVVHEVIVKDQCNGVSQI